MKKDSRIYVAGHRGMVGAAIVRKLTEGGYDNLLLRTHDELDLKDQVRVREFFQSEKPEYVFLAAARVGGIIANNTYRAEFIHDNLAIQTNVIHESWCNGVKRLMFLGSSCIYPRECPQPMREDSLLSAPLEITNRPYAVAKIAGVEMCWSYNRQYATRYVAVMPNNLYGIGDSYHPEKAHALPALIKRVHEAKKSGADKITVWGSGKPMREYLFTDDMVEACVFLMNLDEEKYSLLLGDADTEPPLINIGSGQEMSIAELAQTICEVLDYRGQMVFDTSKPDGTPRKLLDSSRLTAMGWHARTSLDEGIRRAYADFLENQG